MSDMVYKIKSNNHYISLKPYGSTSSVLTALNNERINLGLVGKQKKFINYQELKNKRVYTAIEKTKAKESHPEETNLIFYNSTDKAIEEDTDEIVLIKWEDYSEELKLIIRKRLNHSEFPYYILIIILFYKN